jgi:hypothetical protein
LEIEILGLRVVVVQGSGSRAVGVELRVQVGKMHM